MYKMYAEDETLGKRKNAGGGDVWAWADNGVASLLSDSSYQKL
jgi:hypothetical protein